MSTHDIDLAAEIWAAAQRGPGEGIEDAIERIETILETALQSRDLEDAQRYRWLRENWFTMGSTYKDDQIQFYINGPRYSNATEAELDEAIDHARRVEGEGE